jgi:hypothetical protein
MKGQKRIAEEEEEEEEKKKLLQLGIQWLFPTHYIES